MESELDAVTHSLPARSHLLAGEGKETGELRFLEPNQDARGGELRPGDGWKSARRRRGL